MSRWRTSQGFFAGDLQYLRDFNAIGYHAAAEIGIVKLLTVVSAKKFIAAPRPAAFQHGFKLGQQPFFIFPVKRFDDHAAVLAFAQDVAAGDANDLAKLGINAGAVIGAFRRFVWIIAVEHAGFQIPQFFPRGIEVGVGLRLGSRFNVQE